MQRGAADDRSGIAARMIRQSVRAMNAYVPGTTIEEVQRRRGSAAVIKLASNENPLGSSPKAIAALRHLDRLHLYLDDSHSDLRERLGERYGLQAANVVLGHGSNELVSILCQTLLEPGDEAIMATPSFSLYPLAAKLQGAKAVEIPLKEGVHDLQAMLGAITVRTKLIFVCDPNNPTGTAIPVAEWDAFLARLPERVVLVIDQAYIEYASKHALDAATILTARENVIVLRTMSKIYGLASLRIGYGYGSAETIGWLNRVRLPFNVSRPAALGALGALEDDEFVTASLAANLAGKALLFNAFEKFGLHAYPTAANFYALEVPVAASAAYEAFLERGIIVRSGDALSMPHRLRITIGTAAQNGAVLEALEALLPSWNGAA